MKQEIKQKKTVSAMFFCNSGQTKERVTIELNESEGTVNSQVEKEFKKWLKQNEEYGYSIISE